MLNYIATQVSPPIISYAYLLDSYISTQIHMQCHAYTYVVSVHVVSYAYSILCHSYVTYIVPYPAYLVSYVYLQLLVVWVYLVSYSRLHIPCHIPCIVIFCLLALLPSQDSTCPVVQGVGHKSMLYTVVPYNPTMLNYLLSILYGKLYAYLQSPMHTYLHNSFQFCLPTLLYLRTYNMQCPLSIAKSPTSLYMVASPYSYVCLYLCIYSLLCMLLLQPIAIQLYTHTRLYLQFQLWLPSLSIVYIRLPIYSVLCLYSQLPIQFPTPTIVSMQCLLFYLAWSTYSCSSLPSVTTQLALFIYNTLSVYTEVSLFK